MKKIFLLLFFYLMTGQMSAQIQINNVTVADVEHRKMLHSQTVVINGGKIISVGPRKVKPVPGTTIIDGTGKFLIPGFVDAHVHFFQSGGLYTRPEGLNLQKYVPYAQEVEWTHRNMESLLRRYLAAGITSLIDVGSTYNFLQQRDTFKGKTYAPAVFMSGPLITTWEPDIYKGMLNDEPFQEIKTIQEARQFVGRQLPYKPDLIKIWYIVRGTNPDSTARAYLPMIKEVINTAHNNRLRVAVHATERLTAQLAVEAGADILVHSVDDEEVDDSFVRLLKDRNVVLCPTLVVSGNYRKVYTRQYVPTREDSIYAHPVPLGSLSDLAHIPDTAYTNRFKQQAERRAAIAKQSVAYARANLRKLMTAGVTIATGTDAGNIGTQHASSYFDELRAMQEAGLDMWDLLIASTINGAKVLAREAYTGSISAGKEADLLLLGKNPVNSIESLQSVELIINKGMPVQPDSLMLNTPDILVQKQLNAYNMHDLEAFLAPYAEEVEIYDIPGGLKMKGKAEMREKYAFIRTTPGLYCRLLNRMIQGNTVIDHEEIHIQGSKNKYGIAVYKIENGKIRQVYFIRE